MPTYVYRRPDGTTFEAFQKISDPPLAADPESGEPVERVISGGAGLQFKGSGFYLTDYGRQGSDARSGAAKAGAKDSAKSESTGSGSATSESASPAKSESPAPAKSAAAKSSD